MNPASSKAAAMERGSGVCCTIKLQITWKLGRENYKLGSSQIVRRRLVGAGTLMSQRLAAAAT